MINRMLFTLTLVFFASTFETTTFAQSHSVQAVKEFETQFIGTLNEWLIPYKENGSFIEVAGGGAFSNGRTNISASRVFKFLVPGTDSSVKYTVSLGKYDTAKLGRGGAEAVQRGLTAEVEPNQVVKVNQKLEGEGELNIGDKSYYAGVHSAANTRTSYQMYRHTAFALRGEWLVKIEVTSRNQSWNKAIKEQQKDILKSLINVTGNSATQRTSTKPRTAKKIVDTRLTDELHAGPKLAGTYEVEGESVQLQQDGKRIFAKYTVGNVTVVIDTKYEIFTRQTASGKIETLGAFFGNYHAEDKENGSEMSGNIQIAETDVPGELKLTTHYEKNGEHQSGSTTLKKQ